MLYERIFGNAMALNRYLRMQYIIPEIKQINDSKVLDIGALDGHFTQYFVGRGNKVFTVDIKNHGINRALPEIFAALAKGQCLPFADSVFDFVFCSDVFEHVEDFELIVPEIGRVLKPGKFCLISTVDGYWDSPIKLRFFLLNYLPDSCKKVLMGRFAISDENLHKNFMGHVRYDISLDRLERVCRKYQLVVIKQRSYCRWAGSYLMEIFFSFNEKIRLFIFPLLKVLLPLDKCVNLGKPWQYYALFEKR